MIIRKSYSKHKTVGGLDAVVDGAVARRGPIYWLVRCGAIVIALILVGTAIMAGNFRDRALNSSKRELENTLLLLARHFDQQLDDCQVIQKDIISYMRSNGINTPENYTRTMSQWDVHLMLTGKIGAFSYVGAVNLFDADGKLINSSEVWPLPDISIGDRNHFKELKFNSSSPNLLLAPVYSRMTGKWTTILARRLVGVNGEFLGVITRGIETSHFEKFFASLSLGENAAISMFHRDGTMLARFPHAEPMVGKNFKTGPLFTNILPYANHGSLRMISPVDGIDRLGAVRTLKDYPIVLIATTTVAGALENWWQQTRSMVGVAGLASLVVAIIVFLIIRQISQQHIRVRERLTLEKQRLDTAVNNMNQGLLLFDADHRIVVCNDRYREMYGLSADVVKPGCHFREVIAHRKATGLLQGDVDQYCERMLREMARGGTIVMEIPDGRWIQMTFQPVPDGGWVSMHEDITERRRSDAQIARLAHYDALTDLPNRVLFRQQLERSLNAIPAGNNLAVLYIDVDEFKSVNDSLGHPVGDELLKAIALRLRECVGEQDMVARLGGDEFAIMQVAIDDGSAPVDLVARVYEAIRRPTDCLGHSVIADASIGISVASADDTDLDELLKNADLAMYAAKAEGRRTYRFFNSDMDARAKARRTLELELRQAVLEQSFEVYYQPIVELQTNRVTGCEALLRWHHPVRGIVSPADFIPVAEETGLIDDLGAWVLNTACREAASWPSEMKIAVNVSPVQFRNHAFALRVASALAASGLAANRLELEITETILIRDDEAALSILHQLRDLGVRIALDDFGTGYSSLSYLQRFPFDKIKIDRCFISDVTAPDGSVSIVRAVVNIATARKMMTTAEGVETQQQREFLRILGCTEMQGYLFSPPKPAADIRRLLASGRGDIAVA